MEDSSSNSPSSDSDVFPIPSDYEIVEFVGDGSYGIVAKCKHRDTGETVAIKIMKYGDIGPHEASILQHLMRQNLDQYSIIKFYDWYQINSATGLVMELLEMNLYEYITEHDAGRLPLKDIRFVVKQVANALGALRSAGVIHTDLKPHNIMLARDQEQLVTVKLIDFGLAIHTSEAVMGARYQMPYYRAPEVILGLPITEAIDMWSLGVVMGMMMFGSMIFPWAYEYSQMRTICEILGQPSDHLLDAGLKTTEFFSKNSNDQWVMKSYDQYWNKISIGNKRYPFSSLDDLKILCREMVSDSGVQEWTQCIELLKAMLQLDASERITPSEVLNHPFITQSYDNETLQPEADEPGSSQDRTETSTAADDSIQDVQCQCPGDTLSIKTLMLDYKPAATPGPTQDADDTSVDDTASVFSVSEPREKTKKKEKKKNCVRRFFSWMKRTFTCCCSVKDEE